MAGFFSRNPTVKSAVKNSIAGATATVAKDVLDEKEITVDSVVEGAAFGAVVGTTVDIAVDKINRNTALEGAIVAPQAFKDGTKKSVSQAIDNDEQEATAPNATAPSQPEAATGADGSISLD